MHKYQIGYGSHEESSYVQLEHEKKFTKEEIIKMVAEAIVSIYTTNPKKFKGWKEDKEFGIAFRRFWHQYGEKGIPEWLIENKGFVLIKFDEQVEFFGWASSFDIKDWGGDRYEDDSPLVKEVNRLMEGR